jgi:hypothetical protein
MLVTNTSILRRQDLIPGLFVLGSEVLGFL